ncbi:hypothetical protein DOY81_015461 [Sarcophaga bullata]|nr:hypothetical protein DOY81_015461 [Sarcophaga bullata]
MLKIIIIALLLNIFLATAISQNVTINGATDSDVQEAFKFSNVVTSAIRDYINDALPTAAKPEGEQIFLTVQEGLQYCENLVNIPEDIWHYKYCSSALLRDGMAALASLQAKYRPYASSASRIKLFW